MGHAQVDNDTPFAFDHLFATDEQGTLLLVLIVKGTFDIQPGAPCSISHEQVPVTMAGEFLGKPGLSSWRFEPEGAFFKQACDIVLLGHADAGEREVTELSVGFQVGPVQKLLRAVGDRHWSAGFGNAPKMSPPRPFRRMPLRWENAFGGLDPNLPADDPRAIEARNPLGTGYRHDGMDKETQVRLPNFEYMQEPITRLTDRPQPAGFGFIGAGWHPRSSLAGTYDNAWLRERRPLLPQDFDRRFFNAAPADQIAPGWLVGNEAVTLLNLTPEGRLTCRLPGLAAPRFEVRFSRGGTAQLVAVLDTLVIDTDRRLIHMSWRAHVAARREVQDLREVHIRVDGLRGPVRPALRAPTT